MKKLISMVMALSLVGCATAKLPDPTIKVPKAPIELLSDTPFLKPIPSGEKPK